MRGPGVPPLTATAARENPSGATIWLVIVRFATGPIAVFVSSYAKADEPVQLSSGTVACVRRGRWIGRRDVLKECRQYCTPDAEHLAGVL